MWDRIIDTLVAEFAHANNVEDVTRLLVRLLLALVLGGLLGHERGRVGKAAGLRAHAVCMGSALFVLGPIKAV